MAAHAWIIAVAATGIGTYGLWKGELTFGPEGGSDEEDETLHGWRAHLPAGLLVAGGSCTLFAPTLGYGLILLAILLPRLLRRMR